MKADCPRCEELKEEIAYLKGELGESLDDTARARLKTALRITPKAVLVLDALYGAGGRVVPTYELEDLFDTQSPDSHATAVYITKLRNVLGKGAILNDWGRGYRLSAEAVERVSAILSGEGRGA